MLLILGTCNSLVLVLVSVLVLVLVLVPVPVLDNNRTLMRFNICCSVSVCVYVRQKVELLNAQHITYRTDISQ